MNKIFKDLLTGIDNDTYDIGRVTWLFTFLSYHGLAICSFLSGYPWSAIDIATGNCSMAVCFAANLKIKKETEPTEKGKE